MAYKNKRKNIKHQSEIRKMKSHKKHEREYNRNHKDVHVMVENDYLRMMRQAGII